jgi:hypothetical protein
LPRTHQSQPAAQAPPDHHSFIQFYPFSLILPSLYRMAICISPSVQPQELDLHGIRPTGLRAGAQGPIRPEFHESA